VIIVRGSALPESDCILTNSLIDDKDNRSVVFDGAIHVHVCVCLCDFDHSYQFGFPKGVSMLRFTYSYLQSTIEYYRMNGSHTDMSRC